MDIKVRETQTKKDSLQADKNKKVVNKNFFTCPPSFLYFSKKSLKKQ